MIVVANAGPLIALAQIGQLDVLPALFGRIHIPTAVRHELIGQGDERPGVSEFKGARWLRTITVRDQTAVQLLQERLDPGESAAIVLAIQMNADLLLIDEARGRRVAEARGIRHSGAIGALIAAKQNGLLPMVTPLFDQLIERGFRMSEELYRRACLLADEA